MSLRERRGNLLASPDKSKRIQEYFALPVSLQKKTSLPISQYLSKGKDLIWSIGNSFFEALKPKLELSIQSRDQLGPEKQEDRATERSVKRQKEFEQVLPVKKKLVDTKTIEIQADLPYEPKPKGRIGKIEIGKREGFMREEFDTNGTDEDDEELVKRKLFRIIKKKFWIHRGPCIEIKGHSTKNVEQRSNKRRNIDDSLLGEDSDINKKDLKIFGENKSLFGSTFIDIPNITKTPNFAPKLTDSDFKQKGETCSLPSATANVFKDPPGFQKEFQLGFKPTQDSAKIDLSQVSKIPGSLFKSSSSSPPVLFPSTQAAIPLDQTLHPVSSASPNLKDLSDSSLPAQSEPVPEKKTENSPFEPPRTVISDYEKNPFLNRSVISSDSLGFQFGQTRPEIPQAQPIPAFNQVFPPAPVLKNNDVEMDFSSQGMFSQAPSMPQAPLAPFHTFQPVFEPIFNCASAPAPCQLTFMPDSVSASQKSSGFSLGVISSNKKRK